MTAIVFQPVFPLMWIFIFAMIAIALFGWLEVKRRQKFLFARLFAVCVAAFALALLALKPAQSIHQSSISIVLTADYSKSVFDSLIKLHPQSQVYTIKNVEPIYNGVKIEDLRSLSDLKGNISFLGQGIPEYALPYLDTTAIQFYPAKIPTGFTSLDYKKSYQTDQVGQLTGTFNLTDNKNYTLKLSYAGIDQDSTYVKNEDIHAFSLNFKPKTSGRYTYTLTAADSSGKIIHTEEVPIQVFDQKPLSILFLCDYPSAEIRFLKNFLEKKDHALTLRYKISKDKYRTEFVNRPPGKLSINSVTLENFDLIITDAVSLAVLSNAERTEIKEAMRFGLGVVTLISTSDISKSSREFLGLTLNKVKNDSATVIIQKRKLKIPAASVSIGSDKKIFDILHEPAGRIISGFTQNGLGRSGFMLLTHTFTFQLAGEAELYAALWTPVIEATARRENKTYDLNITTSFPYYKDEPIALEIVGVDKKPTLSADSIEIPLAEDRLIRNVWHGKAWAETIGWNTIKINQDSSMYNFFVASEGKWNSMRIFNQQLALQKLSSLEEKSETHRTHRVVPPYIFCIVFLLAAGFLWTVPKL